MMAEPMRSTKYYQDTVIFKVEDTLFKVAKHYFVEHSAAFSDMFSLPQPEGQPIEGSCDEHPIFLADVKAKDFEALLTLMYPRTTYSLSRGRGRVRNRPSAISLSVSREGRKVAEIARQVRIERFSACMELARRWMFHQIHAHCITQLARLHLSAAEKIVLGRRHHVPSWIRGGYHELLNRCTELSTEEAELIGLMSAQGICTLRESRKVASHYIVALSDLGQWRTIPFDDTVGVYDRRIIPYKRQAMTIEKVFEEELKFAEHMNDDFYAGVE